MSNQMPAEEVDDMEQLKPRIGDEWPDGIEYTEHPAEANLRRRLLGSLFLLIAAMVVAFLAYGMWTSDAGILAGLQNMMTTTFGGIAGWLLRDRFKT